MDFSYSDEQQMLLDTTRRFLASEYGFEHRSAILESADGWSRATWQQLADLGLLAVDAPESDGGIDAGPVGVMLIARAMGEGLLVEPFIPSAVVATRLLVALADASQRERWLAPLLAGEQVAVLAHEEGEAAFDAGSVRTQAHPHGGGWRLDGAKSGIYHAAAADLLLVSARLPDGGTGVFAVPAGSAGLVLSGWATIDGQRAADVRLSGVEVPASARLGEDDATAALQQALDRGLAALCADALGSLDAILQATIEYSRSRVQFGVPIGSFQALQHRMADMLMQVEQARSMCYLATSACEDADATARRTALSAAKVLIGQAARQVGQQAVQLHGGMGMTDELDVSHHFRRLLAFELRMGTTDEHMKAYRRASAAAAD
jgi:alkylation response protein AidB-like acyl-CoA dehydrogenase